MKASDVMTKNVYSVTADETCDAAAHIMSNQDVGVVPVVDPQGACVGIVTDRDICLCAFQHKKVLDEMPVKQAMSSNIICVAPDDAIERVEELMQINEIRRIPVVDDDGTLQGIISMADLARMRGADGLYEDDIVETLEAVSRPHASMGDDVNFRPHA